MRFVEKSDDDKTATLKSKSTYRSLKKIATTKAKNKISDKIYREPYETANGKRSKVEDQLAITYKNKCAYCERICKADIEHYRPKKSVKDTAHDGYYWLCYEWTNLIPACVTCNRDGAKTTHFPIIGKRVTIPALLENGELDLIKFKANESPLIDEHPYLLHPEIDNPEDYFIFEIATDKKGIAIAGIDDNDRGKKTIEICLLNRQELQLDRVNSVIGDFKDTINGLFFKHESGRFNEEQLLKRIEEAIEELIDKSKNDAKTHTLLRKFIVKNSDNFENIVIPFLSERQHSIVLETFKSVVPDIQS